MLFVPCMSEQLYRAGLHKSRKIFDICFDIKSVLQTNERTSDESRDFSIYFLITYCVAVTVMKDIFDRAKVTDSLKD
jgi:hypothetical protein